MKKLNKITFKDLAVIVGSAILFWAINLFKPDFLYPVIFFMMVLLMSFSVFLIKKVGVATLFYVISALLTYKTNGLGISGTDRVVIFLITGIILDLILLIAKKEEKCASRSIITAAIISSGLFPIVSILRISFATAFSQISSAVNLILLSLLAGTLASLASYFIWRQIRTTKFSLRFELDD